MHRLCGVLFALLGIGLSGLAAQEAVIDTRGEERVLTRTHAPCTGTTGNGIIQTATAGPRISVVLAVPDPKLVEGSKMGYDLTITNFTAEDFVMPRSVKASDVVEKDAKEQDYKKAMVSFLLDEQGAFPGGILLYGSSLKPSTVTVLKPGASLRLQGAALVAPQWATPGATAPSQSSLYGVLQMSSVHEEANSEPGCFFRGSETAEGPSIRSENAVVVQVLPQKR